MPKAVDPTIPPVHVDGFDDLRPIGRGGFSYVFSARQRDFNRRVALKVLAFGLVDERERRSFERECRAMGLVSQHPHIVTVFNAAFSDTKQPCIVMELYSGGTLGERVKQDGPLPVAQVLEVGVKICGALQTAHDRGLLHRDIKPHNLFISEFGEPALGDFGISTLDDERSISGGGGLTVHYAPPEVLEGAAGDAALGRLLAGGDAVHAARRHPPVRTGGRFQADRRRPGAAHHARVPAAGRTSAPPARRGAGPGDEQAPRRPAGIGGRVRRGTAPDPGRAGPHANGAAGRYDASTAGGSSAGADRDSRVVCGAGTCARLRRRR